MFDSIPIIDLSQDKETILSLLRPALLNVGFCYISNYGVSSELISRVSSLSQQLFDIPDDEKQRIDMSNSPHFLGYSRLGDEITQNKTDWREQMDLATELPAPGEDEPLYRRLRGPNQWPKEELLPGFRDTFQEYIEQMGPISIKFVSLIAEALGLEENAFEHLFEENQQHKLKVVRYPDVEEVGREVSREAADEIVKNEVKNEIKEELTEVKQEDTTLTDFVTVKGEEIEPVVDSKPPVSFSQGVGPHKDSELTSYLLQLTPHRGLQVLNSSGQWIDVPPIPGTLVVAMGQAMEALTRGYCVSTTHRVLAPEAGSGSRFSVPFFQGISYDADFREFKLPEEVVEKLKESQHVTAETGQYRHDMFANIGEATFMNRIKSHPSVAKKWYKDVIDVSKLDVLPRVLKRLCVIFGGAEKAMMFHNSPLPLAFDDFAKHVREYTGEKIVVGDLQQIFELWKGLYRTEMRRDGMLMLSLEGITSRGLAQAREERQEEFEDKCWTWLKQHPLSWSAGPVVDIKTKSFSKKRGVSDTAESLRKTPVTKQRIFKLATPDTKLGGSVLERIKARKAATAHLTKKSLLEVKQESQKRFIDSNIERVVDVLIGVGPGVIEMDKAVRLVNDSVRRNLSEKEAKEILVRVSEVVPGWCKLVQVGEKQVLRLERRTGGEVREELKIRGEAENLGK